MEYDQPWSMGKISLEISFQYYCLLLSFCLNI